MTNELKCPNCEGKLEMRYGLTDDGMCVYECCPELGIVKTWPDPELSSPEEMERYEKGRS